MVNIDWSAWDASKAWANGAKSDDPAAFYNAICAGKKAGDPATQDAHALPYKYTPSSAPNAAGVRNALARLPQTDGLTNKAEAQALLEKLMKQIQAAESNKARAEAMTREQVPGGNYRTCTFPTELRGALIKTDDGRELFEVNGYATVFERGYEMWDMFGPYTETVDAGALDKSLGHNPDVAFLVNHRGVTMARTTNGSLSVDKDEHGLRIRAYLNPDRQDVRDLMIAIKDKNVTEMSFAFLLNNGEWDEDYESFRITEADINRGDVSAVNYGANPFTNIEAGANDWLALAEKMPPAIAREAVARMQRRDDSSDIFLSVVPEMVETYSREIHEAAKNRSDALTPVPEPSKPEPNEEKRGKSISVREVLLTELRKRGAFLREN